MVLSMRTKLKIFAAAILYKIVALLLLEYFYHSFGYGIGQ